MVKASAKLPALFGMLMLVVTLPCFTSFRFAGEKDDGFMHVSPPKP